MEKETLFDRFPPVSTKQWKQLIQYGLKGADYNERLVWESSEGINVKPFYNSDDLGMAHGPFEEGTIPWRIVAPIAANTAETANEKAKQALASGAEALHFSIPDGGFVPEVFLRDLTSLGVPIFLDMRKPNFDFAEAVSGLLPTGGEDLYLNLDILGHLAFTGRWYEDKEKDHLLVKRILAMRPIGNVIAVDTTVYQNAGGHIVQQLAYAMAHVHEYLGDLSEVAPIRPLFKVAIGGNYFFEIVKIRALRRLWALIAKKYDIPDQCRILAIPSQRNKSREDSDGNLLRTTMETMAAILGGADFVQNTPYGQKGSDQAHAERLALQQLLITKYEARSDAVANPADGAYYIESLTGQLAEKALILWKHIEANGGFFEQLKQGTIQRKIHESAKAEQMRIDTGQEVLVGVNKYRPVGIAFDKVPDSPVRDSKSAPTEIRPLPVRRLAYPFETKTATHG